MGADLNAPMNNGRTPAYIAAQNGHVIASRVLKELGAHLYSPQKGSLSYSLGCGMVCCGASFFGSVATNTVRSLVRQSVDGLPLRSILASSLNGALGGFLLSVVLLRLLHAAEHENLISPSLIILQSQAIGGMLFFDSDSTAMDITENAIGFAAICVMRI